jgi:transposase
MEHYVGLDVSLKLTAICIVDRTGKTVREGVVTSDPETIAAFIKSHAPHVARVGLEAGATSTWLWTELNEMGLPVICIDARHAKAVLKMQINKSDRNDAVGIARIMQCGWYKEVRVKDLDSHATKALLISRALLVKIKRDIENQIRGLLKNLGLPALPLTIKCPLRTSAWRKQNQSNSETISMRVPKKPWDLSLYRSIR